MPPTRYRSILLDLYGAFVRDLGNWIAVADLVTLAAPLDVDEQAVRSSVSRFARKGLLRREVRNGQAGYELTDQALGILAEGDVRIFDTLEPARLEDGWVLAAFSIPEPLRAQRHQLRSRLSWLGFGNLAPGLWLAPRRVMERAVDTVREVGLEVHVDVFAARYEAFDDLPRLVERCWDLAGLQVRHAGYVDRFGPALRSWSRRDPDADRRRAYADYVVALHEWRKTPYLDPGLPTELLPASWPGTKAAEVFEALRARLEPAAGAHVGEVVGAPVPARTPRPAVTPRRRRA